jgi:two-component system CheB/CheR fusion protein
MATDLDPSFEALLEFVRDSRGFDYRGYKRPSLMRRFRRRLETLGVETFDEYREVLETDTAEFGRLFDTILINVTGFFRDGEAWDLVAEDVIPKLLDNGRDRQQIRVWSAGCATGEEAYSAAILFAEAIGEDQMRERVKIYATDIDDQALSDGRTAIYTEAQLESVPAELRERYFHGANGSYSFKNGLRRTVIFGRNDLLQDPPISRVDLLISRNTLMYFGGDAQDRVLANFAFALNPRGFLMVGRAESLQSRTSLFEPYDLKRRIFVRNTDLDHGPRLPRPLIGVTEHVLPGDDVLRTTAFETSPVAQIVVEATGRVTAINATARATFALRMQDVGHPLQDLEISYRPVELRSLIERVLDEHRPVSLKDVAFNVPGQESRTLDVLVGPLTDSGGALLGVSVSFADVSRYRQLHDELETVRRDLETAYEELQSTVEELETTNEELQSTNEELETTNEELQSTNEELETMNEELQSTNEELEAMNDELRDRTDEALHANAFLGSILWSIEQAVIVVDTQLRVTAWSNSATELWGLREGEVDGQHFLNLNIGLPVGELRDPLRNALSGNRQEPVTLSGHNRRGQSIVCEITFAQLRDHLEEVRGVILVMAARSAADV